MSGKAEQEPSIEEILASIRQIISDDDAEQPAAAAPPPPPPPPPKPAPAPAAAAPPPPKDDVFELTDVVDKPAPPPPPPPPPPPKPKVEVEMRDTEEEEDSGESILTNHAADAALDGFMKLAANMAVDRKGTGTVTLEDIVRELMRPMLREWLDVHLPPIIEKVVQRELDKIARKAVDE